jgi:hypothetical protein
MTYRVHIDFETRSIVDLRTRGSTIYAQHELTEPIMLAVIAPGTEGVRDFLNHGNEIPASIKAAMDADATFVAHNARFEQDIWYWICHLRWGWPMPRKWSCTAARAAYWGLRRSLDGAASDLELPIQKQVEAGKQFINTFCVPRKFKGPKKNGIIAVPWAEPHELPDQWAKGLEYCLEDARTEAGIDALLPDLPPFEQKVWELDFAINTHGIPIDTDSVGKAIHFSDQS